MNSFSTVKDMKTGGEEEKGNKGGWEIKIIKIKILNSLTFSDQD